MIKTCQNCERKFKTYDKTRKFCSHKCYHEHQIKEHSDTCPICKKVFHKSYKGQKYCSVECRGKARENESIKLVCPVCEKVFYKKYYEIKTIKTRPCCSLKCNHKYKSKYNHFLDIGAKYLPLYNIWHGMMHRCYDSKQKAYKDYGERGIQVSVEWQEFENFYKWAINNGYQEGLSIERIDVNGDYKKDNCKWIEPQLQARNKRTSVRVNYKGQEMILKEIAELEDINYKGLWQLYKKQGKNINEAVRIAKLHKQGLTQTNTSGFRGVAFYKNAWNVTYKKEYLGRYKTFEEAVQVRLNAEKQDKKE